MPGGTVRALAKTKYTFTSLSTGAGVEVVIAKGLDVSAYPEATLLARLHAKNISPNTGTWTVKLILRPDAPTPDDPASEWTQLTVTDLATVTFDKNSSVGAFDLQKISSANAFGGWLKLILKPTQSATTPESPFEITVSADIIVKS